jgi:Ca2+-binding EF-hand superfamily protein
MVIFVAAVLIAHVGGLVQSEGSSGLDAEPSGGVLKALLLPSGESFQTAPVRLSRPMVARGQRQPRAPDSAMKVLPLDSENFQEAIAGFDGLSVVKFYAPWCSVCRRTAPLYEKISKTMAVEAPGKIRFYQVNFKLNKQLALSERVVKLPTVHFYTSGFGRVNGLTLTSPDAGRKLEAEVRRYVGDSSAPGHLDLLHELRATALQPLVRYVQLSDVMQALHKAAKYDEEAEDVSDMVKTVVETAENEAELDALFDALDVNHDGVLDAEEIAAVAAVVGGGETSPVELLLAAGAPALDRDDSPALSREAFKRLMTTRAEVEFATPPEEELLAAFEALDLDGDGVITREEMQAAMARISGREGTAFPQSVDDAPAIFDALDVDKSGSLDYEEFVAMMSGHRDLLQDDDDVQE